MVGNRERGIDLEEESGISARLALACVSMPAEFSADEFMHLVPSAVTLCVFPEFTFHVFALAVFIYSSLSLSLSHSGSLSLHFSFFVSVVLSVM